jgi:hypothetical protein
VLVAATISGILLASSTQPKLTRGQLRTVSFISGRGFCYDARQVGVLVNSATHASLKTRTVGPRVSVGALSKAWLAVADLSRGVVSEDPDRVNAQWWQKAADEYLAQANDREGLSELISNPGHGDLVPGDKAILSTIQANKALECPGADLFGGAKAGVSSTTLGRDLVSSVNGAVSSEALAGSGYPRVSVSKSASTISPQEVTQVFRDARPSAVFHLVSNLGRGPDAHTIKFSLALPSGTQLWCLTFPKKVTVEFEGSVTACPGTVRSGTQIAAIVATQGAVAKLSSEGLRVTRSLLASSIKVPHGYVLEGVRTLYTQIGSSTLPDGYSVRVGAEGVSACVSVGLGNSPSLLVGVC